MSSGSAQPSARLVAALRTAGLNKLLEALAARYGLKAGMLEWEETPEPNGHNNSRFAAYQLPVAAADGRPALLGSVWFSLPGATSNSLSGLADLRISFDAIRSAPGPAAVAPARVPVDLQVRLDDLIGFFAQAWQTTTMVLPLAITTNPPDIPLAGPPRLELYITNERPEMSGAGRPLQTLDMVDLSSFGQPRRSQLGDLSVGSQLRLAYQKQRSPAWLATRWSG